jgi:hypothetical protein
VDYPLLRGKHHMNDWEVILQLGTEGGSVTLYGMQTEQGWLFSRSVTELIDEERIPHDSPVVDSWEAAIGLLDRIDGKGSFLLQFIRLFRNEFGQRYEVDLKKITPPSRALIAGATSVRPNYSDPSWRRLTLGRIIMRGPWPYAP